jgi:hypothetical protein
LERGCPRGFGLFKDILKIAFVHGEKPADFKVDIPFGDGIMLEARLQRM